MTTLEDHQPVHAHWIPKGDFGGFAKEFVCSHCGKVLHVEDWTNKPKAWRCPYCEAVMDDKGRDDR